MGAGLPGGLDSPAFGRLRASMAALAKNPPHTLLLEGGSGEQRFQAALYWARACNCENGEPGWPCLGCAVCRQIESLEFMDLKVFDGRIANSQDEEGGLVRALSAENMRELKKSLRDAGHGHGRRVVILMGLGLNRGGAANALLKSLEEPPPDTSFVLLAAQREQLLPTLVSRSFCLTLPWPDSSRRDPALAEWESLLGAFISGRGDFLERLGVRGAVDPGLAASIILAVQKALVRAICGQTGDPLADALCRLDPAAHIFAGRRVALAREMLDLGVSPARALESLACRLWQAAAKNGAPGRAAATAAQAGRGRGFSRKSA